MNIFSLLLFPLALVFRLVVSIRNFLYDLKILNITKVKVPVLSVGNITVGGTGKTPYILKLVETLKANGKRPAVIYRGYKRTGTEAVEKVGTHKSVNHFGDEASLVAFKTGVPVYVGKKRVEVARKIIENEKIDVILLDDGFQHRALYRDLDFVILDATDSWFKYLPLPSGRAREPLSSLKRAQVVALHKINLQPKPQVAVKTNIRSSIESKGLVSLEDWKNHRLNTVEIPFSEVSIVCGVAKPEQVAKTFNKEFPQIKYNLKAFSDHHIFLASDIPSGPTIITEKDAIKIKELNTDHSQIYILVTDLSWDLKYEELSRKLFTSVK